MTNTIVLRLRNTSPHRLRLAFAVQLALPIAFGVAHAQSATDMSGRVPDAKALDKRALCTPLPTPWACVREGAGAAERWVCSGSWRQDTAIDIPSADAPTDVSAAQVDSTDGLQFSLTGGVSLVRGNQRLDAPGIELDKAAQTARTVGPARLETRQIIAYANSIEADLANDKSTLGDVRYALKDGRGNGRAKRAVQSKELSTMTGVSFTSCPGDIPAWQVQAHKITLDQANGVGHATDFKVVVGKIPVFYFPRASFPLTDARKSGLLAPTISGGNDGFDFTLPYYLNLAPNYDATLATRVIQRRGVMLGQEFRYLGAASTANVNTAFMPHDRLRNLAGSDNRYSVNINLASQLSPTWRFGSTLNQVSDDYYFEDLGDSLTSNATSIIGSEVGFYGRNVNSYLGLWNAGVSADYFDIIDPANPESANPYRRAPRLYFNSAQVLGPLNYGIKSELVQFRRANASDGTAFSEGQRFDATPFISAQMRTSYGYIRPELSFRHTRYSLDATPLARSSSPRRSVPIAAIDAGLYFDRPSALFFPSLRQTLEPRLYYLRTPFRDQSGLPAFDTTELDFSFSQLFRTNRFSGADRQSDANQVAAAITTRWIDDSAGTEKIRLSVGQIRYFDDSFVTLPGGTPFTSSAGVWVAEAQAQLGERWRVSIAKQYDPVLGRTRLAAARLQRQIGDAGLINFGYRYRFNRLEQADISGLVPINDRWSLIGRWNYSLPEDRTLEGLAGFEYQSCCWRLRLIGRHYLRAGTLEGKNTLFFELELNGLGVLGRKTDRLLDNAIVGFSELTPDAPQR
jgi:LPS-assembly protein